jgi:hypothetical protein
MIWQISNYRYAICCKFAIKRVMAKHDLYYFWLPLFIPTSDESVAELKQREHLEDMKPTKAALFSGYLVSDNDVIGFPFRIGILPPGNKAESILFQQALRCKISLETIGVNQ